MSREEIRHRVREAIAEALDVSPSHLPSPATADTVDRWDSLGHFQIIETLSRKFDVAIDHEEAVLLIAEDLIVELIRGQRDKGTARC